jgi:thiol-disulfide isomerase/thioredoxin
MQRHRPRQRRGFAAAVLLLGALVLGTADCSRRAATELEPGSYRATVELPGKQLVPFGLDVAREERGIVLYLVNGPERVRVHETSLDKGRLTALVPGYETKLSAQVSDGKLRGEVELTQAQGRVLRMPLVGEAGVAWRFYPEPRADNADLAGRWAVTFTDAQRRQTAGVLELAQRHHVVTGTTILPADDERYLAGEVHDEELRLSRFDGGAAVLYEARLDAQGRLVGETWSDRGGHRTFVATRNPDASVNGQAVYTQLRNPEAPFSFAFRDLDGQTMSSTDPRLTGKVLLVTLSGSWCPNSHDEARLLVDLDRRYRAQGLAVVGLMFEQHAEFERAVAAVRRFRAATGIEYPTLIAGTSDKESATRALPQLDAVRAYPTTLFIDRSGRVQRIHTGFAGPAAGVRHELLAQEFAQTIESLLAGDATLPQPATAAAPAAPPVATVPQAVFSREN